MMWVLIKAAGSVWICSDLAKCCKINRTALHSPNVSKWIVAQGVLQRNWMFINSQVRQMLEIKLKAERAMNRHSGTESSCSTEANDQKCVHKCKLQLHFNVSLFWLCLVYSCKKKKLSHGGKKTVLILVSSHKRDRTMMTQEDFNVPVLLSQWCEMSQMHWFGSIIKHHEK